MIKHPKILLIYNPQAGSKRKHVSWTKSYTLEEIQSLLQQYQIVADMAATNGPGDATKLATKAVKDKCKLVLVAGGDGTISEVASCLVNTNVTLGILPLGTMMNIAWMLSIPTDLEKAVQLIKIGRKRKIDVGAITQVGGDKLQKPYYFLENAGLRVDEEFQRGFIDWERGKIKNPLKVLNVLFQFRARRATIEIDKERIQVRAPMITVSNGPRTGAALTMAPQAKLNDHRLTVSIFKMDVSHLVRYFIGSKLGRTLEDKKIQRYQAKIVRLTSHKPQLIHVDGRLFGTTPVEIKLIAGALKVISGFPKPEQSALTRRTRLDP